MAKKKKIPTRGILMFGTNNNTVDYLKLCIINALLIKKNMGDVHISVVTTEYSLGWEWAVANRKLIDSTVNLIIQEGAGELTKSTNARVFRNTQYYTKKDMFCNSGRSDAYSLSPYEETLLIDCDYLILSDSLNSCWGSVEDFMISKDAVHLNHGPLNATEWRLSPFGIRMYWATVVYFRKTERAQLVFELVEHIKQNWLFYSLSYDFPGGLYRNDFAFSIAIHMLSGFQENADFVTIPDTPLLSSLDKDQLYEVVSPSKVLIFAKNLSDDWTFTLQKIDRINVHIMNKLALLDIADDVFKVLGVRHYG